VEEQYRPWLGIEGAKSCAAEPGGCTCWDFSEEGWCLICEMEMVLLIYWTADGCREENEKSAMA